MINIAIDGPSGAGKSSISRRLAQELGFLYVDTGAMYRCVGLHRLRQPPESALGLDTLIIDMRYQDGLQRMYIGGEDVTEAIRGHEVSQAASEVSALPEVRAFLLERQRSLARENHVIMDGRDIGTVVLPDARVKIFLTATPEDRARRRYEELRERGQAIDYDTVLADVVRRDYNDSHRAAAPLRPAQDAIQVDTTGNSWEQSVAQLLAVIRGRLEDGV